MKLKMPAMKPIMIPRKILIARIQFDKIKMGRINPPHSMVDVVFREIAVVPSPTRHIISIKTDDH